MNDADDESPPLATVVRPVELYEYVGRGRSQLLAESYFELPGAVASFRAAMEIDGTYAPAHAGLARALCAQAELRTAPHVEAFAEAKALALRALAIDRTCVDAHVALGSVLFLSDWDWPAAERTLLHSLGLGENPPSSRRITYRVKELCRTMSQLRKSSRTPSHTISPCAPQRADSRRRLISVCELKWATDPR